MKFFDSHFHIIDHAYPVVANQGYLPPNYTCNDYLKQIESEITTTAGINLALAGGAVVSGSFQLYDQSYLVAALKQLGPSFVGVTQLPQDVSEEELDRLHAAGVRAIRFNINRGVMSSTQAVADSSITTQLDSVFSFAQRLYQLHRWHAEFYIDSQLFIQVPHYFEVLHRLAELQPIVIDHVAMSYVSFHRLADLYRSCPQVYVKVTGFGRISFTKTELQESLQTLIDIDPKRVMFGTDLPSTRAKEPFSVQDVLWLQDCFGREATDDHELWTRLMCSNAYDLYFGLKQQQ